MGKSFGAKENILVCPFCKSPLHRDGSSFFCGNPHPHCFDIAKSGYCTLTGASGSSGDDREMVRARTAFLDTGAYEPLAKAVTDSITRYASEIRPVIIDAGCGEGYYTDFLAQHVKSSSVYGFDLSKSACDHAAKRSKASKSGAFFGVSSIYTLPVADKSADIIVNLFAPVAEREFARVLKDGGILIVAAAGKKHLYELKRAVYSEVYENEGRRDLPVNFEPAGSENLTYSFTCDGQNLRALFSMTPYAFKTSASDAAKLDKLSSLEITADFDIFTYKKKGS